MVPYALPVGKVWGAMGHGAAFPLDISMFLSRRSYCTAGDRLLMACVDLHSGSKESFAIDAMASGFIQIIISIQYTAFQALAVCQSWGLTPPPALPVKFVSAASPSSAVNGPAHAALQNACTAQWTYACFGWLEDVLGRHQGVCVLLSVRQRTQQ
eukprot:1161840-Pelagomonas_calceolata.AAC.1